ncbi:DUF1643 domain-containing protein [Bifidobacterium sp. ESL0764]|uniref:DUF1643 domain-containing protein n=1 Tax=Bifidobacterium sp. ESL0764 TaxID=2983228 RepID=UPI0023FA3F47|nr:DUF1643 domain-containing protein [Bifidobacterium sp. ESL0764]WEV65823.1 DUF1643 domain-containing protein [Bifidobacterium sp. ESL0764]
MLERYCSTAEFDDSIPPKYRYSLTRYWGEEDFSFSNNICAFILMNPSTASASTDDATIKCCVKLARQWNCDGIIVMNLYALRATRPNDLWKEYERNNKKFATIVGSENNQKLQELAGNAKVKTIVLGWGNLSKYRDGKEKIQDEEEEIKRRVKEIMNFEEWKAKKKAIRCLCKGGKGTKSSPYFPMHPLGYQRMHNRYPERYPVINSLDNLVEWDNDN